MLTNIQLNVQLRMIGCVCILYTFFFCTHLFASAHAEGGETKKAAKAPYDYPRRGRRLGRGASPRPRTSPRSGAASAAGCAGEDTTAPPPALARNGSRAAQCRRGAERPDAHQAANKVERLGTKAPADFTGEDDEPLWARASKLRVARFLAPARACEHGTVVLSSAWLRAAIPAQRRNQRDIASKGFTEATGAI